MAEWKSFKKRVVGGQDPGTVKDRGAGGDRPQEPWSGADDLQESRSKPTISRPNDSSVDGIVTKTMELAYYLKKVNIDISMTQETKLCSGSAYQRVQDHPSR